MQNMMKLQFEYKHVSLFMSWINVTGFSWKPRAKQSENTYHLINFFNVSKKHSFFLVVFGANLMTGGLKQESYK